MFYFLLMQKICFKNDSILNIDFVEKHKSAQHF